MPIGLPESGTGSSILEDGLILSHAVVRDYFHWAGGSSYNSIRVMGLTESIISTGGVAMAVDSWTRLGGDTRSGLVNLQTSTNGLIRFDGNISGRINSKWYYAAGAYVNMDPTSVNAPTRKFVDQKQIYKLALTRKWKRSQLDLIGKFSLCGDAMPGTFTSAPFVYNGDGTVSLYNGFRLGRDCYYTADDNVSFKDVVTGQTRTGSLASMNTKYICDLHSNWSHELGGGWSLGANFQFCFTPSFQSSGSPVAGVVDSGGRYTYSDGGAYGGKVQLRSATIYDMGCDDLLLLFKARKETSRTVLNLGFQGSFANQFQHSSSFYYAHTVEANPQRLYLDGASTWKFNTNALFYECKRFDFSLYATEDWHVSDRFFIKGGARVMLPFMNVKCAANRIDPETGDLQTVYNRYDGFNIDALLSAGTPLAVITQKDIEGIPLDYHFSAFSSYRLADGLFAIGEGFFSHINKNSSSLKGYRIPSMKAMGYAFGSFGLTYDKEFSKNEATSLKLVGSYISNWNNASITTISNPTGTQMNSFLAEYGIGTWGVTFDGTYRHGGFGMHTLVTWQDPRYRNYSHTEHFDDGSVTSVVFSGKYVTSIPHWRVEIDPSWSFRQLKVTANIRYFSRQYASRNNYAYFNGHFETFGSVVWKCSPKTSVVLTIINPLFQTGAKGSVSASDAATSEAELAGIVMSGSYIRPFTMDLGLKINL